MIKLKLGLKMKVKVEVPNCLMSKQTLVKEESKSESKSMERSESKSMERSVDERSIASTETSSPVIKACGSTGVDGALEATLEATETADRISPHGAWSKAKSEGNGVSEKEAPVSNTIGSVGARVIGHKGNPKMSPCIELQLQ